MIGQPMMPQGMPQMGGGVAPVSPEAMFARAKLAPHTELQSSMAGRGPFTPEIAMMAFNFQKQMGTAQQGQQALMQMQQPTVRNKEMAELQQRAQAARVPEHMGIAMAPGAQQMGDIPEGGVVGMASGGSVRHFAGGDYTGGPYAQWLGGPARTNAQFFAQQQERERLANLQSPPATAEERPLPPLADSYGSDLAAAAAIPMVLPAAAPPAVASRATGARRLAPAIPAKDTAALDSLIAGLGAGPSAVTSDAAMFERPASPVAAPPAAAVSPATAGVLGLPTAQDYIDRTKSLAEALGAGSSAEREALANELAAQRERILGEREQRREDTRGLAALQAAGELLTPGRQGLASIGAALKGVVPFAAEAKKDEARIQDRLDAAALAKKQMDLSNRRGDMDSALKASGQMQEQINAAGKIIKDDAYQQALIALQGRDLTEKQRHNMAAEYANLKHVNFQNDYWQGSLGVDRSRVGVQQGELGVKQRLATLEENMFPTTQDLRRAQAEAYRMKGTLTPAQQAAAVAKATANVDARLKVPGALAKYMQPGETPAQTRERLIAEDAAREGVMPLGVGVGTPSTGMYDRLPADTTALPFNR
jgi:hypothetical protein